MKQVNRNKPNPLSHPTGPTMRINGKTVSRIVARYDYRCAECFGTLEYSGAGLACVNDHAHRGYIYKTEAAQATTHEEEITAQVSELYQIIDGKLVAREII